MTMARERGATAFWPLVLAAAVILGVVATHHHAPSLELRADDYAILRPFSAAELHEVITGSWSGTRTFQDRYYRPLAGLYQAGMFAIFGLNAPAMHWLSLLELAAVVWLLAVFLWRETRSRASLTAAALYLVNPLLRASTSAWIFNQFHLIACVIVLATLLLWQNRRHSVTIRAWFPILASAAIGWYVKEDTVMVLPALLACQALRARWSRDVPAPSRRLVLASAILLAGLVALRFAILSQLPALPGRDSVSFAQGVVSFAYGLGRPFFARAHQHVAMMGTALLIGLGVIAMLAVRYRPSSAAGRLATQGAVLLAAFALPLIFQPSLSTTRMHLVLLASAFVIAGGCVAASEWLAARGRTAALVAAVAILPAGAWSLQSAALGAETDLFAPCSPVQLSADAEVAGWEIVAPDVRGWLPIKTRQCAGGRAMTIREAMPMLRWAVKGRWTVLLPQSATAATLFIGDATASHEHPRQVDLMVAGTRERITIGDPRPVVVTVPLRASFLTWLRDGHRIDIRPVGAASLTLF